VIVGKGRSTSANRRGSGIIRAVFLRCSIDAITQTSQKIKQLLCSLKVIRAEFNDICDHMNDIYDHDCMAANNNKDDPSGPFYQNQTHLT